MFRNIFPSPALMILVACGIAISYASQQAASYDPNLLAICTLLFIAGCVLAFSIVQSLPEMKLRIIMSRTTWQRAKWGLILGVLCIPLAFGWLLWGFYAFGNGSWLDIAIVMGPTLILGLLGLVLIYYWLGLWAFGEVEAPEKQEKKEE
ncbi:MAG TPA: hypothetical protein VGL83_17250 [Stellaceae bacterium]|jgi:hypothetical protein